jgi:hypothetical protein
MEKQPTEEELAEARRRGRADAVEARRRGGDGEPGDAGPYAFAPESLQAEYDRAYDEARADRPA